MLSRSAGFAALAAARDAVLERAGGDARDGLAGAPRVRVLTGAEGHETIDSAARMLGLGVPGKVAADAQGRLDPAALEAALASGRSPTIVVLQAGNLHSGAFDQFEDAIGVAHRAGAWVHIDGAFGLWAGASPRTAALVRGIEAADSWSTDAHKTLNVPYDCGVSIVADPTAAVRALGLSASYLEAVAGDADPHDRVPELSRRARGVPVWAALRSLGVDGVAGLVDGLVVAAQGIAAGIARIPGLEVRNDVVFTQVCAGFADDERTRALGAALAEEGEVFASPSTWHGRAVVRCSVSNAGTDARAVARTVAAFERAAAQL
ncbi:pyridoxal-dependent decarboxylase [Agromyces seonyuensis]|uniref:Aspartate aminotransferase family protein n=1 Tax=Agromyces seonyuensis TaxID=2662446 RepID=A0A6I4P5Z8_9MICO|nr:aspartate aminotransferase family protein [Agromyces seonyuensis]